MDSVVVDGVTLLVYPSAADHGRWAIAPQGRDFGALTVVVDALIRGMRKGWIEAFHERQSIHLEHMSAFFAPKHMLDDWKNLLRWSSFGGSEDEEDFYVLTIEMDAPDTLIPTKALLSIIALLLERSGLDPTRTPEPLGTFDPNASPLVRRQVTVIYADQLSFGWIDVFRLWIGFLVRRVPTTVMDWSTGRSAGSSL